jgi:hypothetical protein
MKTKNIIIIVLAALMPVITSCNWVTKSIDDTLHGRPTVANIDYMTSAYTGNDNFLTNKQALTDAEQSLRAIPELKGKKLIIYGDAQFYDDGRIMIDVQDPDTASNVNEYDFNGQEWGPGKPVQMSTADINNMNMQSFALDTMPFARIQQMAIVYASKAKQINSTTTLNHIYYVPDAGKWYCNDMESPRANYELYLNPNGTVKEFKRE